MCLFQIEVDYECDVNWDMQLRIIKYQVAGQAILCAHSMTIQDHNLIRVKVLKDTSDDQMGVGGSPAQSAFLYGLMTISIEEFVLLSFIPEYKIVLSRDHVQYFYSFFFLFATLI